MSTPKQRVIEERSELHSKLGKLSAFIGTAPFFTLSITQQALLQRQAEVMASYLAILDERLLLM